MESIIVNDKWNDAKPYISVMTPVYNRMDAIQRTIKSIENQIFRDFEFIVVDDGSTDDIDAVILPFLNSASIPVMYIKKENGGVHTARNAAVRHARGMLFSCIDSDDEFLPDALQKFYNTWINIPDNKKKAYREIVGLCMDQNGELIGARFPDNINELPWKDAIKACEKTGGEHIGCDVTQIRKENLFPEPDGVTFMTENILWYRLFSMYKSYFINDIVRIYHMEGNNHLSTALDGPMKKKNLQSCRNALWMSWYTLSDWEIYGIKGGYLKEMLRYCIMKNILKRKKDDFCNKFVLVGLKNKVTYVVLWLPGIIASYIYEKRKMNVMV